MKGKNPYFVWFLIACMLTAGSLFMLLKDNVKEGTEHVFGDGTRESFSIESEGKMTLEAGSSSIFVLRNITTGEIFASQMSEKHSRPGEEEYYYIAPFEVDDSTWEVETVNLRVKVIGEENITFTRIVKNVPSTIIAGLLIGAIVWVLGLGLLYEEW